MNMRSVTGPRAPPASERPGCRPPDRWRRRRWPPTRGSGSSRRSNVPSAPPRHVPPPAPPIDVGHHLARSSPAPARAPAAAARGRCLRRFPAGRLRRSRRARRRGRASLARAQQVAAVVELITTRARRLARRRAARSESPGSRKSAPAASGAVPAPSGSEPRRTIPRLSATSRLHRAAAGQRSEIDRHVMDRP